MEGWRRHRPKANTQRHARRMCAHAALCVHAVHLQSLFFLLLFLLLYHGVQRPLGKTQNTHQCVSMRVCLSDKSRHAALSLRRGPDQNYRFVRYYQVRYFLELWVHSRHKRSKVHICGMHSHHFQLMWFLSMCDCHKMNSHNFYNDAIT